MTSGVSYCVRSSVRRWRRCGLPDFHAKNGWAKWRLNRASIARPRNPFQGDEGGILSSGPARPQCRFPRNPMRVEKHSPLPEKESFPMADAAPDPWFQPLFADRLGGANYGKGTEIYKFEKIKRAKRKAMADHPERKLLDFGIGENDDMAAAVVREALKGEADKVENRGTRTTASRTTRTRQPSSCSGNSASSSTRRLKSVTASGRSRPTPCFRRASSTRATSRS